MASIAQLFIVDEGFLDVSEDILMPMSWNINDIKDLGNKGGAWTRSVILYGTNTNNQRLGDLFDVNISNASFDRNAKYKCVILRNGEPAFDGFFRLLNITKKNPSSPAYDEQVIYQCQIYDALSSLNQDIQNKYLEDIDLSQYDHNYVFSAITATSAHTYANGYKYHNMFLAPSTPRDYYVSDYKPGIFAPVYFRKIFEGSNHTYEWNSFTATGFDRTFVPFNGETTVPSISVYNNSKFFAGMTGSTGQFVVSQGFGVDPNNYTGATMVFNDDSNFDHYDSGGTYNPVTGIYTANYIGRPQFQARMKYKFWLSSSTLCNARSNFQLKVGLELWSDNSIHPTTGTLQNFPVKLGEYKNVINTGTSLDINSFAVKTIPFLTQVSGLTFVTSGVTSDLVANLDWNFLNYYVYNGMKLHNRFSLDRPNAHNVAITLGTFESGTTAGSPVAVSLIGEIGFEVIYSSDTKNYFTNLIQTQVLEEGGVLSMNDYIPKKVKQSEFLSSIIRKYNLFLIPSRDKERHIEIKTRDEYFDEGNTWDFDRGQDDCWLDTNSNYKIAFIQDTQSKIIRLKDKDDSDVYNKAFKDETRETYGQVDFTLPSAHLNGVNEIDNVFSPTPLEKEPTFGNIVSTINVGAPKNNIRLVYDCGWITGETWTFRHYNNQAQPEIHTFTSYPHCGHFWPNPINPEMDLNYALPDYMFYNDWEHLTNNNQYNRFWRRHFSQLENGRILTGMFKLSDKFIRKFNMNDRIYVLGTYWNISKINDYDFNSNSLTEMELIEVDEGLKFAPTITSSVGALKLPYFRTGKMINDISIQQQPLNNVFAGANVGVNITGIGNQIGFGARNVNVNGTGNTVGSSDVQVFGSDNTVNPGISGVQVFGNNVTADTSNAVYSENVFITSAVTFGSGVTFTGLNYLPLSGGAMDSGAIISASTGGGQLELDYATNEVLLSNDNGVFSSSQLYLSPSYIELSQYDSSGQTSLFTNSGYLTVREATGVNQNEVELGGGIGYLFGKLPDLNAANNPAAILISDITSFDLETSTFGDNIGVIINSSNNSTILSGSFRTTMISAGASSLSGDNSVLIGGNANNVNATNSGLFAGINNSLTSPNSTILGGSFNLLTGSNSAIIGGTGLTGTSANTVYMPAIAFESTGSSMSYREIPIGDWDMDATANISIPHSLSSTQWKTIRNISATIIDDADTGYYSIYGESDTGQRGTIITNSTSIQLFRVTGGIFDSTAFNATSFNRGYISFWYNPNV